MPSYQNSIKQDRFQGLSMPIFFSSLASTLIINYSLLPDLEDISLLLSTFSPYFQKCLLAPNTLLKYSQSSSYI